MAEKGKTAKYYANNPAARKKKAAYDKKNNAKPKNKAKRAELGRHNYAQDKKKGGKAHRAGKDASHTKKGIVYKKASNNRGSKSDTAGDKRARGGKKK